MADFPCASRHVILINRYKNFELNFYLHLQMKKLRLGELGDICSISWNLSRSSQHSLHPLAQRNNPQKSTFCPP